MTVSRRQFLTGAAALGTLTALGACHDGSDGDDAARPARTTTTEAARAGGPLVLVTLYGGNDGLNTVVPVADPTYSTLRGALAIDPEGTHDIGEGYALHPSLAQLAGLWGQGRAAVVHGVGFAGLDRSHFHCMDVWQAGDEHDRSAGWVGRWLDLAGDDPLDAVMVGQRLPLLARGQRRSASVVPPGPFVLPGDHELRQQLTTMVAATDDRPGLLGAAARSTADLLAVVDRLAPVMPSGTADDSIVSQLEAVATMIEADLPTRVYGVELGSFDTHAAQADTHAELLGQLDTALGAFLARVPPAVTVVVYSEFGRRVAPNASAGTDHGSAGTMLLAGAVRPGHHGEPPPLDALDDGDLATTVDFRAVLAGVVGEVLGTDPADVFEGDITALAVV